MNKRNLLKSIKPVLEEANELVPAGPVKVNKRMADYIIKSVNAKKLKRIIIAGGGAAALVAVGSSVARLKSLQFAVAREMKKQLAPINAKLDELEKQNAELKAELEKQGK